MPRAFRIAVIFSICAFSIVFAPTIVEARSRGRGWRGNRGQRVRDWIKRNRDNLPSAEDLEDLIRDPEEIERLLRNPQELRRLLGNREDRAFLMALAKVREHIQVTFGKTEVPDNRANAGKTKSIMVQTYADAIAGVKGAGRASLIFFETREEKGERLTPQAEASGLVKTNVFKGEAEREKINRANFRAAIATKLFHCVIIDVTKVVPEKDKIFCSSNAPLILLTDKEGKVVKLLSGSSQCKTGTVYMWMQTAQKAGGKDIDSVVSKINKAMIDLLKAEYRINLSNAEIGAARRAMGDADRESQVKTALSTIEKAEEAIFESKVQRYEAIKSERGLLKMLGLSGKALPVVPPEPVDPHFAAALEIIRARLAAPWIATELSANGAPPPETDAAALSRKTCTLVLSSVEEKLAAGKPSLVFFATGKKDGDDLTAAAEASEAAKTSLFTGDADSAHISRSDFRTAIAARFFNRVLADVTKITTNDNRVFCSSGAPAVILARKDRTVAASHTGKKQCVVPAVYSAMSSVLKESGRNIDNEISNFNKALIQLLEAEYNLGRYKEKSAEAKKVIDDTKNGVVIKVMQLVINNAEDVIRKAEKDRAAALASEKKFYKAVGLDGNAPPKDDRPAPPKKDDKTPAPPRTGQDPPERGPDPF